MRKLSSREAGYRSTQTTKESTAAALCKVKIKELQGKRLRRFSHCCTPIRVASRVIRSKDWINSRLNKAIVEVPEATKRCLTTTTTTAGAAENYD